MTRLRWDEDGQRFYEAGVDRGVFYPQVGSGLAWNGLISVEEAPIYMDEKYQYIDGVKYRSKSLPGSYAATIEAFTYPDEFAEYDGEVDGVTNQARKTFGLCYRTGIGNDRDGMAHGYKIHLVYNALVAPSDRNYETVADDTEPTTFSWELTTNPIKMGEAAASSHLTIDTRVAYSWAIESLEAIIYGTELTPPRLPEPQEVFDLFENASILKITDHGDGTWSAEGPDSIITQYLDETFEIDWPSIVHIDQESYLIRSL